ncbi:MAG: DUF2252 family protein [Myxococcota bacterium]
MKCWLATALFLAGCAGTSPSISTSATTPPVAQPSRSEVEAAQASFPQQNALWADPAQHDFSDNPGLLKRILSSPHGYYRFINRRFTQAVCRCFRDLLPAMPTVNLHGDAHVEQYAITSRTRGLVDFDAATTGPPILDLVRFGVSIYLTAHHQGWTPMAPSLYESFLDGYQDALADPSARPEDPALVAQLRAGNPVDPVAFLRESTALMMPLEPELEARVREALAISFARIRRSSDFGEEADFFAIKKLGGFGLGIGSALSEKYLIRVEGPTVRDEDDVIFEAKELQSLGPGGCTDGAERVDPVRVLAVRSRFEPVPERYLGYARIDDRSFWMHDWQPSYLEMDAEGDLGDPEDFAEIVYDVGFQLGRGHPEKIASPRDAELRDELRSMLEGRRGRLHHEVAVLHQQVIEAWQSFVQRVAKLPSSSAAAGESNAALAP